MCTSLVALLVSAVNTMPSLPKYTHPQFGFEGNATGPSDAATASISIDYTGPAAGGETYVFNAHTFNLNGFRLTTTWTETNGTSFAPFIIASGTNSEWCY